MASSVGDEGRGVLVRGREEPGASTPDCNASATADLPPQPETKKPRRSRWSDSTDKADATPASPPAAQPTSGVVCVAAAGLAASDSKVAADNALQKLEEMRARLQMQLQGPRVGAVSALPLPAKVMNMSPDQFARRVYVGNIPYEFTDVEVRALFCGFGFIRKVDMMHDHALNQSKGFCFVEFDNPDSATLAIQSMNGLSVGGRALKVGRPVMSIGAVSLSQSSLVGLPQLNPAIAASPPECRVFVSSVPFEVSDKQLRPIFEAFGRVLLCELQPPMDNTDRLHRGYGTIVFESPSAAVEAVKNLNGLVLLGRPLKVTAMGGSAAPAPAVPAPAAPAPAAPAPAAPAPAAPAASSSPDVPTNCVMLTRITDAGALTPPVKGRLLAACEAIGRVEKCVETKMVTSEGRTAVAAVVRFQSTVCASIALRQLSGRVFDTTPCHASAFGEEELAKLESKQ